MKAANDVSDPGTTGDERVVDQRVELMKRHWRNLPTASERPASAAKTRPQVTIAISRQRGALGSEIGAEVGKLLDWPVYDRKLVDLVAERSALRAELLESIDEHDRPWLIETLTGFSHPGEISSAGYLHHLKHVIAALASHGRCVIVGRGATALLPSETTLRVRVHAPLEVRMERVASEKQVSSEVARGHINEVDRSRASFVASHFKTDVSRADLFDMVISTQRLSAVACAEMIVAAAKSFQAELEQNAK